MTASNLPTGFKEEEQILLSECEIHSIVHEDLEVINIWVEWGDLTAYQGIGFDEIEIAGEEIDEEEIEAWVERNFQDLVFDKMD